ncbi:hypothetical protein D9M73_151770 [compost metagenome]
MNGGGPARQTRMLSGCATAGRQLPGFDADDLVVEVEHQSPHFALAAQARTVTQGAGLERGEQAGAGHARTFGAVATGCRFGAGGIGRHGFVAGVIEVVLVTRVRGFMRRHAGFERRALSLQPGQLFAAAVAEIAQCRVADGFADFLTQVIEHGFAGVFIAGLTLIRRATTGVHHATTERRGAAAFEAIQCEH